MTPINFCLYCFIGFYHFANHKQIERAHTCLQLNVRPVASHFLLNFLLLFSSTALLKLYSIFQFFYLLDPQLRKYHPIVKL